MNIFLVKFRGRVSIQSYVASMTRCRLTVSPAGGYWAGRRRVRAAKEWDTTVGSWAPDRIHFSCSRGRPMLAHSTSMRLGCVSRSTRCFCTRLFLRHESCSEPPSCFSPTTAQEKDKCRCFVTDLRSIRSPLHLR